MFQDNALAYTKKFSMIALEELLSEWLISHILWPGRSPDLNPYDYIQLGWKGEGGVCTESYNLCEHSTTNTVSKEVQCVCVCVCV